MDKHIKSRQNARVKAAARLRQRRQRERQGRCLVDGAREISRALDAGVEILEAYVCEPLCTAEAARRVAERLQQHAAFAATVTNDVFEKLCFGDRNDGVVAVAATPQRALDQIQLPRKPLAVVIEGLEKPGNVGAVLRSADGAGADAVIVADPATDLLNPNTIRASLGVVFRENVCTAASAAVRQWLKSHNLAAAAARVDGAIPYDQFDFTDGVAVVLGSEATGLSDVWSDDDVTGVRLPMLGAADSLNVSATAAVLLYEARRQRRGDEKESRSKTTPPDRTA